MLREEFNRELQKLKSLYENLLKKDFSNVPPEELSEFMKEIKEHVETFTLMEGLLLNKLISDLLLATKEQRIEVLRSTATGTINRLFESSLITENYEICECIKIVREEREKEL